MYDLIQTDGGDGCSRHILEWLDAQRSGPTANDGASTVGEDDQGFTSRLYQLCLHTLQDICRQQRNQGSSKSCYHALRECLGRLYLWGEPFGVGELDKALEQSDELRDSVIKRLAHIGKLLLHKSALWIPPSNALHQQGDHIKELKCVIKQGKLIVSTDRDEIPQNGHENDEEYDSGGEGLSDSGSYDTIDDIGFATACLLELGPSLEQNLLCAENARNQRSYRADVPFSVSTPGRIYVNLVREKFPQAHYKLVERLGESNWQRHKEIRKQMENPKLMPEERAKSLFRPYSDFHDSGIGTSVPAQTDYAPSHTSIQSSIIEGEEVSLRVPREPSEVAAGKPFQCFLCRCIISNIKNRIDWKIHVFADLRPYICTFPDCKDELAQFTTRAAWADHEFTKHRYDPTWRCPECSEQLSYASDWEQHLQEMHRREFTGPQLHIARKTAYQTLQRQVETEECPLCHIVLGKPRRAFVKHTARHMEEIALMALPRSTEEDSDESSISTNQISQGSKSGGMLAPDIKSETCKGMSIQGTDGSATTGSVSSITAHPQVPSHAPGNEAEEYVIKCICGFREDDGNTVYCDLCDTWQHTKCYYIDKHGNVPTKEEFEVSDHFCVDCQPRSFHTKGAVERQRIRRKEFNQTIGKNDELEDLARPFLCKFEGCERARGFRRLWDLKRHLKNLHGYSMSEASNESLSLSPSKFEDSGGLAGVDAKKRRDKAAVPRRCHSCNRAETPEWRHGPDGPKTLCNACGLHYAYLTRKMGPKASDSTGSSNLQSKKSRPHSP